MTAPGGSPDGVRFSRENGLVEQALELLAAGPREPRELASAVLGIHGGPELIAGRLIRELFRDEPRVRQDTDGRWAVARQAPADAGFDGIRFAVVDVETNGGIAGNGGRIIEIAIVHVDGGQITDTFSTLVDSGVAVSPWITRLTGIRTEMIQNAPTFSRIAEEVRERMTGRVFVAHSAGYDWGFVREEMRSVGASPPRGPRLCTVHFARRLLPGLDRRGLDALARYYRVEIRDRHRARGDAVATAQILIHMLADAERRGWATWGALRAALREGAPRKKRRAIDGWTGADRGT